ncbi:hypothetical protein ACXYTP_17740 [Tsukamurella ocularis]
MTTTPADEFAGHLNRARSIAGRIAAGRLDHLAEEFNHDPAGLAIAACALLADRATPATDAEIAVEARLAAVALVEAHQRNDTVAVHAILDEWQPRLGSLVGGTTLLALVALEAAGQPDLLDRLRAATIDAAARNEADQ